MKRILVLGSGGAGKSTFATRLGELLKLEVVHLDQHHWQPGWVAPPKEQWLATVDKLIARDGWVMDGNFSGTIERRVAKCDTIIFLDLPRTLCLYRIIKRRLSHRGSTRPDMAPGCPEKIDLEFMLWVWNYARRTKPKIEQIMRDNAPAKKVITLRTPREVEEFLTTARAPMSDML
jgi:adenylate kinase family enzyme